VDRRAGGRTSYGSAPRPVAVAGIGVWARRAQVTVAASVTRSFVGDTAYSDVGSTIHANRGRFEVDGSLAARVSSRGAGHGVSGEASTTYTLGERVALFVSGGRYPTDPVSGSVAGRYVSAGLRLRPRCRDQAAIRDPQLPSRASASGDGGGGFTARLEVQPTPDGSRGSSYTLSPQRRWRWPAISRIGQPVALHRRATTGGKACCHSEGVHRVNVGSTVGGGPRRRGWRAPRTSSAAKWGLSPCPNLAPGECRCLRTRAQRQHRPHPARRPGVPGGSCSSATPPGPPPMATDRS